MNEQMIKKAAEIVVHNTVYGATDGIEHYCVLAMINKDGYPTVSTITPSKADGINWITFCTGLESNKGIRARRDDRASVCFNTGGAYNITLVGRIEIITDNAIKHEMWYEGMGQHFTSADDINYCVLRFITEQYNLFIDGNEVEGVLQANSDR